MPVEVSMRTYVRVFVKSFPTKPLLSNKRDASRTDLQLNLALNSISTVLLDDASVTEHGERRSSIQAFTAAWSHTCGPTAQ